MKARVKFTLLCLAVAVAPGAGKIPALVCGGTMPEQGTCGAKISPYIIAQGSGHAIAHKRRNVTVTITVQDRAIGTVKIGITSDNTIDIDFEHLRQVLGPVVSPTILSALQTKLAKRETQKITLADLRNAGIKTVFTGNRIEIAVVHPLGHQTADGGRATRMRVDIAPPRKVTPPAKQDELEMLPDTKSASWSGHVPDPALLQPIFHVPVAVTPAQLVSSVAPSGFSQAWRNIFSPGANNGTSPANSKSDQILAQISPNTGVVVPIPPSAPSIDTAPPVTQTPPVAGRGPNGEIWLIVPFKERGYYIGDITIAIAHDGSITIPVARLTELLQTIASPTLVDSVRKQAGNHTQITLADLNALKLNAVYDPASLEVSVVLPLNDRKRRELELLQLDQVPNGQFRKPASPSAWLTWRTSFDYVNKGAAPGQEFVSPAVDLTGAFRYRGVVLTAGGRADTAVGTNIFQRDYTRLTYDEPIEARRWTLGDLEPSVVGFQTSPDMAGISVLKSYAAMQPGRNIRPRGLSSFSLNDPSTVDVMINGQLVKRMSLDAGTYDLSNFPFTVGQNNVQLVATDSTGRRELYSYQQFFDLNLLESGLSEYQLAFGVGAPFQNGQPHYDTSEFVGTGFYRRGITNDLTLGANVQADTHGAMLGLESIWATRIGVLGTQIAGSKVRGQTGWAALMNFQHQNNASAESNRWSVGLNLVAQSKRFSNIGGTTASFNDVALDATAFYTHALDSQTTINFNAGYQWKRSTAPNSALARLGVYRRIGATTSLGAEARYSRNLEGQNDYSVYLTLTTRFSDGQYASASYDGSTNTSQLSYQMRPTTGYNNWSFAADAQRTPDNIAINANAYKQWNRIETSLNHSASYDESSQKVTDERTSLRLAGSIAYADGAVAVGKPIYNSFAIVEPHESLDGKTVRVDPIKSGELARTDILGPALISDLSGYSRRTLTVAVDDLPTGYNLESGSFDLMPPDHSGYKMVVGSDYSISVIGVLDDRDGQPVTLVAGKAYLVSDPKLHPVEIFTDRKGRFAIVGLKPGLWRIDMGEFSYDVTVAKTPTLQRLTTPLKPLEAKP